MTLHVFFSCIHFLTLELGPLLGICRLSTCLNVAGVAKCFRHMLQVFIIVVVDMRCVLFCLLDEIEPVWHA